MRKFMRLFVFCALMCLNICVLRAVDVATIAEAKALTSGSKFVFSGELTLQYVSEAKESYFAFDANNDYVRLRDYGNWSDLTAKLKVGDKIVVTDSMTFFNDDNNCVTFELTTRAVKSVTCVGSGAEREAESVTVGDLNADANRVYNAKFVKLSGVNIESITDYVNFIFITRIVDGDENIDFYMELTETNFPSVADVFAFVDYREGKPRLFIPSIDYVRASSFDNIAGLKLLTNKDGYNNISFASSVLVTNVEEVGDNYLYFVQQNTIDGNPVAMQMVVPKSLNIQCQVGDSVSFDVVGSYMPASYEATSSLNKMTSATYTVVSNNATKVISSGHAVEVISFDNVLSTDGWLKYDNCLAITLKGDVVTDEVYSSIGCVGLKLKDALTNKTVIVPVVNKYYIEVGSPSTAIVCGFVCGYKVGNESYAVLMPRSKNDFLSDIVEFNSIADLKAAGRTPSRAISYKLNSALAITGFTSEKFEDTNATFYKIFVQDHSGAIQLNHQSSKLQKQFKVGDVITGVVGYYTTGGKTYVKGDDVYFASAPALDIQDESVVASTEKYEAKPVVVSLAELNDSHASQLVTIKNVTYSVSNSVPLNGDVFTKPLIYQGNAWTIVSDKFEYASEMGSVTGVYYLYGVMTQIMPRTQSDIVVEGYDPDYNSVDDVVVDDKLFVENGVVCAFGAMIEVYDVMGRIIASGVDMVNVENCATSVMIVKTKYADNAQFVTKLINR